MTRRVGAVLFDCYGTLLRLSDDRHVTKRYARMAKGREIVSPMTMPVGLADSLRGHGIAAAEMATLERDLAAEVDGVQPIGDAVEMVREFVARGFPVAIVSNLSIEYAAPIRLLMPGVPLVASYQVGCAKPDARIYAEALRTLGARASDTLMIGDSPGCDHDGAVAAGMTAILLGTSRRPEIETAGDVAEALEKAGLA